MAPSRCAPNWRVLQRLRWDAHLLLSPGEKDAMRLRSRSKSFGGSTVMSLLRPRKPPGWLPRYSRPAGVFPLIILLILVVLIIWYLRRTL